MVAKVRIQLVSSYWSHLFLLLDIAYDVMLNFHLVFFSVFFIFYFYNCFADIKECEDPKLNTCEQKNKCVDMPPGNYTCSCPEGYHGDGRTDGTGCIANQFLAIQIAVGKCVYVCAKISSSQIFQLNLRKKFR